MVVISEKLQELFLKRRRNETFLVLYIFTMLTSESFPMKNLKKAKMKEEININRGRELSSNNISIMKN